MNKEQKQAIEGLERLFNKKYESKSNGFTLINVDALNEKTNKIKFNEQQEELDRETWENVANQEAYRIIKLLKKDLPHVSIQKYGHENRHHDLPTILIRRSDRGSTHHLDCVTIEVVVERVQYVDEFDTYRNYGCGLVYRDNYRDNRFETIDDLVQSPGFLETLRTRVL
jgi:hypothetical protein